MKRTVRSFDGTEAVVADVEEPDRYGALLDLLATARPLAVRGAGLSYCLASSGDGVRTISTKQFNRILDFDRDRGVVTVEPGVQIGDLLRFAVARGWYFPVLPGYPTITVGGCVAFNVHGKTQHNVGHFSDRVLALTLLHPTHGEVRCSPTERPDVLGLTVGGMGLTGYIADVTLELEPLRGGSVRRLARPVTDLSEAVEVMRSVARETDALYAWNDLTCRGRRFGRGVVYDERFEPAARRSCREHGTMQARARRRGPTLYTRATASVVNRAYLARDLVRRDRRSSVEDAAFPISGNEAYYRLFGRRGFREYQLLVPDDAWPSAARAVQRLVERSSAPVTLGSLKLFSGRGQHLWFRGDGVCLTLDAPATPDASALFGELDAVVLQHGGLVNLSKDSRIGAGTVQRMFSGYEDFRRALGSWDPVRHFDSALRRRLEL